LAKLVLPSTFSASTAFTSVGFVHYDRSVGGWAWTQQSLKIKQEIQ
jgi:hypothetical protein